VSCPSNEYRCEVRLCPEPEGGHSAYVAQLPGVVSEGRTVEYACMSAAAALIAALRLYRETNEPVPWREPRPLKPSELSQWIVVSL